jgi:hypothetical protein
MNFAAVLRISVFSFPNVLGAMFASPESGGCGTYGDNHEWR